MTFLNFADAHGAGFPMMRMYNKADTLVKPSASSVQAAMSSFQDLFVSTNSFAFDILDAGGVGAWPMAYFTYATFARNIEAIDCSVEQALMGFFVWIQTNDGCASPSAEHTMSMCIPLLL